MYMRASLLLYRVQCQVLLHSIPRRRIIQTCPRIRHFASAGTPYSAPSTLQTPALAAIQTQFDKVGPRLPVSASEFQILSTPSDFYSTLKAKILSAKKRIYLSTLYIGKTEHELISTIRQALSTNGPELKVSILTDALRGTRESPEPCCASMLADLVKEFPDQVEVRMYHTPNLKGFKKWLIPKRINEGWGLQHIKLYACDDEIILSGANLSSDYFTNRQDRYHLFSSQSVTDYFTKIHDAICSVSFRVVPLSLPAKFKLLWPEDNKAPSPLKLPKTFISRSTRLIVPLTSPSPDLENRDPSASADTPTTVLYPFVTYPPRLNMELPFLHLLLTSPHLKIFTFTAGYFNPHPSVTERLLYAASPNFISALDKDSPRINKILTAHPHANGFFGSSGISGLLPAAYSHLALRFSKLARRHQSDLEMREWKRGKVEEADGWTYHAKGMWLWYGDTPNEDIETIMTRKMHDEHDEARQTSGFPSILHDTLEKGKESLREEREKELALGPQVTFLGSSNHTTRSNTLDLEAGAVLITEDPVLRRKLKEEEAALVARSEQVTIGELRSEERRADWRTRVAMWIVGKVGGAL